MRATEPNKGRTAREASESNVANKMHECNKLAMNKAKDWGEVSATNVGYVGNYVIETKEDIVVNQ